MLIYDLLFSEFYFFVCELKYLAESQIFDLLRRQKCLQDYTKAVQDNGDATWTT